MGAVVGVELPDGDVVVVSSHPAQVLINALKAAIASSRLITTSWFTSADRERIY
jgi:hypothetical protein